MKKFKYRVIASVFLVASLCVMPSCSSHDEEPVVDLTPHLNRSDSLALVSIYQKIGPWNEPWNMDDITTWNGVATALDEEKNELRVVGLEIWNGYFKGEFPVEICQLTELRRLVLVGHYLYGKIPDEIGNLKNLILLDLSSNQLSGTIPESIGQLTHLRMLAFNNCAFEGSLPSSFNRLRELERLIITQTQIGGEIPSGIKDMHQLNYVILSNNKFSGTFPTEILRDNLLMDFDNNDIEALPFEIWNDSMSCAIPILTNNKLNGPVPEWVQQTERWQHHARALVCPQKEGYGYDYFRRK